MALIDKETIRKEIQRLEQNILSKVHHYPIHRIELLNDLLAFLDTLPEQPVEGLEDKIKEYFKGWTEDEDLGVCHYQKLRLMDCYGIARYFAEWGAEHLKR